MRNFPDLVDAWMEYQKDSAAPLRYQRWAMISCIAAALERKVWLYETSDAAYYPNLYVFLVGPAGSGKTTVGDAVAGLLQEVEGIEFLSSGLNKVSLFHELESIGRRKKFHFNGENFPHSAALLYAGEASETFVAQYSGGEIIGKLTELYNGGPPGWTMKHGIGYGVKKEKHTLLNPCVNLLACSTADWLVTKCMTRNDAAGGFGSRILLVVSKERLKRSGEWGGASQVRDTRLRDLILEDLREINKMQGAYVATSCFAQTWRELNVLYEAWLKEQEKSGLMGGYQERKLTQACKVAMILAASRRSHLNITGKDLWDAWKLLSEIEPQMIEVLSDLELSPDAKARREILAWMKKTQKFGTLRRQAVYHHFVRYDDRQIETALRGLLSMGRIRPSSDELGKPCLEVVES